MHIQIGNCQMTATKSSLPEWVPVPYRNPNTKAGKEFNELRLALSLAWEALEDIRIRNGDHPTSTFKKVAKEAMDAIRNLGDKP